MNQHPIIGAFTGLLTGVSGLLIMQIAQLGVAITVGFMTIYLLYIQIQNAKAKKNEPS
jgi:uncharacterized metal-binding protein